ncbi:TetR/AcrR family transcriptional regulator [Aeromicrobium yanjiei]|uniref:TetR family transcriptional regulator n=1 Tax=Aeromicrobium yanjiei TaxID=2662028 RepID=A0A5Q2MCV0_9ACTN|nr:TetR/AcrR family transcriptional regulator [Aeromicrobium yanjiei]QGG40398.1 TetR family transcriptional regulator [Aeromicrobium yanjiei]
MSNPDGPPSPAAGPAARAGLRADARRNQQAVFAAACEVFAAQGMGATIPVIAERAGVGKATVYRSYPTKGDLVEAVAREQIRWLDALAAEAEQHEDAFQALADLLGEIAARLAEDRLFGQVLGRADQWRGDHERAGVLDRIVAAAQRQGTLRPDATTTDLQVLVSGFSTVLLDRDDRDPATWRHYVALVLDALRPPR